MRDAEVIAQRHAQQASAIAKVKDAALERGIKQAAATFSPHKYGAALTKLEQRIRKREWSAARTELHQRRVGLAALLKSSRRSEQAIVALSEQFNRQEAPINAYLSRAEAEAQEGETTSPRLMRPNCTEKTKASVLKATYGVPRMSVPIEWIYPRTRICLPFNA